MASEQQQQQQQEEKEVCRRFRNTGSCRFGDTCQFEHSEGDPIPVPARQCHKFSESGECQFGDVCRFVHGENDPRCDEMGNLRMETQVCRNFRRGACADGDNCVRRHLDREGNDMKGQGLTGLPSQRPALEPVQDEEGNEACRLFYYFGECHRGDKCTYVHLPNPNPEEHLTPPPRRFGGHRRRGGFGGRRGRGRGRGGGRGPRSQLCRDFQAGACERGEECRWKHVQAADDVAEEAAGEAVENAAAPVEPAPAAAPEAEGASQ